MAQIALTVKDQQFVDAMRRDAGEVAALAATINGKLKGAFREVDYINRQFSAGLGRMGDQLKTIGTSMSTYITAPITLAGGAMLRTYGELEKLKFGLQDYGITMRQVQQIAKTPGLGVEEAARSIQMLADSKFDIDLVKESVVQFGNALARAGRGKEELHGIFLALNQIKGKGKIQAEEVNQIAERLPIIRSLLTEIFGTSDTEKLQKMGITADEFLAKITERLKDMPRAVGGFSNAWGNIIDSLKMAAFDFGEIANKLFDFNAITDKISAAIENATAWFKGLSPEMQKVIFVTTGLLAAMGPLLVVVGGLTAAVSAAMPVLTALSGPVGLLSIGVTALGAALLSSSIEAAQWERMTRSLGDTTKLANTEVEKELILANSYVETVKSANIKSNEFLTAKRNLIGLSPEFAAAFTNEKVSVDKLNESLATYKQRLVNAAETRLLSTQLDELVKAKNDLETNGVGFLDKAQAWNKTASNFTTFLMPWGKPSDITSYADNVKGIYENKMKGIRTAIEDVTDKIKSLNTVTTIPTVIGGGMSGSIAKGISKEIEKQLSGFAFGGLKLKPLEIQGAKDFFVNSPLATDLYKGKEMLKSELSNNFGDLLNPQTATDKFQAQMQAYADGIKKSITPLREGFTEAKMEMELFLDEISDKITTSLQEMTIDLISGIGEAIGSGGGFGNVIKNLLNALGNAMIQIGKQFLLANETIKALKVSLGTTFGIGGSIAAIALGGIIKGLASRIEVPKLAQGGLAYGPTLAMIGDNKSGKEAVIPFERMGEFLKMAGYGSSEPNAERLVTRISGNDLLLILERAKRN